MREHFLNHISLPKEQKYKYFSEIRGWKTMAHTPIPVQCMLCTVCQSVNQ